MSLDSHTFDNPGALALAKSAVRSLSIRIAGGFLAFLTLLLTIALATWNIADPSFNHATGAAPENMLGVPGALIADTLIQIVGMAIALIPVFLAAWAFTMLRGHLPAQWIKRSGYAFAGLIAACLFFACLPAPETWPLPTGLGGVAGDGLRFIPQRLTPDSFGWVMDTVLVALSLAAIAYCALKSIHGGTLSQVAAQWRAKADEQADLAAAAPLVDPHMDARDEDDEPEIGGLFGFLSSLLGGMMHSAYSLSARGRRLYAQYHGTQQDMAREDLMRDDARVEPQFQNVPHAPAPPQYASEPIIEAQPQPPMQAQQPVAPESAPLPAMQESRVQPSKARLKQGQRLNSEAQPSLLAGDEYEFPPLRLLAEAPAKSVNEISAEALDQNARLLESVLEDFGVRGEIINVRPGPVVTLYELEPAPGTKSSRVIGLADDIARSMSAISARVAVVSGRNAIGIELPNANRDTVYLRELLASEDFEKNKSRLPLCLGKTIGGEPVIADLARMPHLLIAGTTGSGKSVAINTMILSILYRLGPENCKLIMVDPKMLELSVYDGIPHLLAPVVTDPRKAVVALKWTVREMEDRYRKMSKVGVRNIDGYNQKVASAGAQETFSRQVQTGFDPETGQPIYETEEVALERMPYIVVIIDEMADLMMVAGKEIEGAVQRLAQMARAAGIHVVMATQRPSVDVITGTIKANFPTRISFQVTSKIDSRTILGEQGAEQLLGQGDMLYMMGGGRITRVHGPFCSDEEVEDIVAHLKAQGAPAYLDEVTEEPEEGAYELPGGAAPAGGGNSGNELYDQAVAIVIRDRKASTSYVQRRLSIGYNRAATLIEKMEEEGVISRPNSKGQREVLVGEDATT